MARIDSPAPTVIIPCSQAKASTARPARDLYVGPTFRRALRTALALTTPDRVLILSAHHGLLDLDAEVAPYDLRFGQDGAVTPATIRSQAAERGLAGDVVVIASAAYRAVLAEALPQARPYVPSGVGCGACSLTHPSVAEVRACHGLAAAS